MLAVVVLWIVKVVAGAVRTGFAVPRMVARSWVSSWMSVLALVGIRPKCDTVIPVACARSAGVRASASTTRYVRVGPLSFEISTVVLAWIAPVGNEIESILVMFT